jgi:ribosome recycling factor
MAEDARIRLRRGRDEVLSVLSDEKKSGAITEDDFYDGRKKLDEKIGAANKVIADMVERKETDIRTV